MTALVWDQVGERKYQTGVDRGVLYIPEDGVYATGFAWNGLETVTEKPSGGEATPTYADNIKYLNLLSVEEFMATIEAYTYPDEFGPCDGSAEPETGVSIGQQRRRSFGLSYRTRLGNDVDGADAGYLLHLVYGCLAKPSEKAYATINDTPEAITFSWDVTTTPVTVTDYANTASLVIDSTKVDSTALAELEEFLYGTESSDPSLPLPDDVIAIFADSLVEATPVAPFYWPETETVTIPTVTGVVYKVSGVTVTGDNVITGPYLVKAYPASGYKFPVVTGDEWFFNTTTLVTPGTPTYDSGTDLVTIPGTVGVVYKLDGVVKAAGTWPITADAVVNAYPAAGYAFPTTAIDVWAFTYA